MREWAEFNKSCNLIGSGSGQNFPIRPALGGRNRYLLKNVSILSGNLLNDLFYYGLSISETSFFNLDYLCFHYYLLARNLALITALKCSGLLHAFHCVVEKNKKVIHQSRSVRIGKNCALCLACGLGWYPRPWAQFFPILTSLLVNNLYK